MVGAAGIPLSEFLGWDQHSQDVAIAFQGHESHRCRSCGHHPDSGPVHGHIYICPGCVALEALREEAKDIPGAHLRVAPGLERECERCAAERDANRPVTKD